VAVRYVMKDGRLYEASTLDEIWPQPRPLGRQWWQENARPQPRDTTGASGSGQPASGRVGVSGSANRPEPQHN
jgi:hypothetical protein